MFDMSFNIAFEEFYTRWVFRRLNKIDKSYNLFNTFKNKTEFSEFMTFLLEVKKNEKLKEQFDKDFNKEAMKSFILYIYKNVPEIEENKRELNNKNYDLVWMLLFFNKVIKEYYLDIEEYKREKVDYEKDYLQSLQNIFEKDPSFTTKEDYDKVYQDIVIYINKLQNMKKMDFVVNGKYSNEDLFKMMCENRKTNGYLSSLPCKSYDFILSKTDLIDLFNYPLKDYTLMSQFIRMMAYECAKTRLKEFYDSEGDMSIPEKYDKQRCELLELLDKCKDAYLKDEGEYVFHKIDLSELEPKFTSDGFFGKPHYCAEVNVQSMGCHFDANDPDCNDLYSLFIEEHLRVEKIYQARKKKEFDERMKKNPKLFERFKAQNRIMKKASSFGDVLKDD